MALINSSQLLAPRQAAPPPEPSSAPNFGSYIGMAGQAAKLGNTLSNAFGTSVPGLSSFATYAPYAATAAGLIQGLASGAPIGNTLATTGLKAGAQFGIQAALQALGATAGAASAGAGALVAPLFMGNKSGILNALTGTGVYNHYLETRRKEHNALTANVPWELQQIDLATTPEELQALVNGSPTSQTVINPQTGTLQVRGTHLNTASAESGLNKAYNDRMALFAAAQRGDPTAVAQLAEIKARADRLTGAVNTAYKNIGMGDYSTLGMPGKLDLIGSAAAAGNPNFKGLLENSVSQTYQNQLEAYNRFLKDDQGRTPMTAPNVVAMQKQIKDLSDAAGVLGYNLYSQPYQNLNLSAHVNDDHYGGTSDMFYGNAP